MLALGIDIGTSGVRTAVVEGERLVSMARSEHPPQDPAKIDAMGWWQAVEQCLSRQMSALKELGIDPSAISGVAVDGTSGTMVLTDRDLTPVSPGLMYNSGGFDTEANQIAALVDGPHITLGSNSALARAMRLVALSEGSPAHLLHQADFIAAKIMGQGGQSDFNNALKTSFDPKTESWPAWIDQVIDPGLLPRVNNPGSPMGPIAQEVSEKFGLSADLMVHAGTTDSIAAFLACAPMEEGVAVTSLGSTLAIKLLSAKRIDDPGVGLYSHRLGDLWLVGGASNTGGAVLKQHFTDEQLRTLSNLIDPHSPTGLDYYPLAGPGERFPINDPNLPPRLHPRPEDQVTFLQAMLEGMAAIEARCYEEISTRGGSAPTRIYTAGGGAKNTKWTAIRALSLGQTPVTSKSDEASIGVAKLARN